MVKLITASEAFALSKPETNIDQHIEYINQQIKYACKNHEFKVSCDLWDCSYRIAIKIAAYLNAAGYSFTWRFDDGKAGSRAWFDISWESVGYEVSCR